MQLTILSHKHMYLLETKFLNGNNCLLLHLPIIILKPTEAWQESEASQSSHKQLLKLS